MTGAVGFRRAGEQLVPRAEARAFAIDDERKLGVQESESPIGVPVRERAERRVESQVAQLAGIAVRRLERRRPVREPCRVVAAGARGGLRHELCADARCHADVLRIFAPRELATPRRQVVHPGADGVSVAPQGRDAEGSPPAVVAERRHRRLVPLVVVLAAPQELGEDGVVAVGEAVGLDGHHVARDPLGREAPAVDLRGDRLDHRPHPALGPERFGHREPPRSALVKNSVASGGSVRVSDWNLPCAGTGAASKPPKLPLPSPP